KALGTMFETLNEYYKGINNKKIQNHIEDAIDYLHEITELDADTLKSLNRLKINDSQNTNDTNTLNDQTNTHSSPIDGIPYPGSERTSLGKHVDSPSITPIGIESNKEGLSEGPTSIQDRDPTHQERVNQVQALNKEKIQTEI